MRRFYGEHSDSPVYLNLFVQFLQHIAALYSNFYRTIEMHAKKMRITFYYCIRFKSTIIFIFAKPNYKSFMIMSHYTTNENVPTYGTITSPKGGGYYQENRLKDERTKKI